MRPRLFVTPRRHGCRAIGVNVPGEQPVMRASARSRLRQSRHPFWPNDGLVRGQNATELPQQKEKKKQEKIVAKAQEKTAQRANLEIRGNHAFDDKTLRSQLKEQIATIEQYGLTTARGDDAAFFLELYYKKHGYAKVHVSYALVGGNGLRLDIAEGPLVHLGQINFVGVGQLPKEKVFEYAVRPTQERFSKTQALLPFVTADVEEGADLVRRFYASEGFIDCTVEKPVYDYVRPDQVDARIVVHEGQRYFFGETIFIGPTIYGGEALRGQMLDLIGRPYTEARLADIPRRLQSYYKTRGYFAVKVDAIGEPTLALHGRVPVRVTIEPGPVYRFDGVTVRGTRAIAPELSGETVPKIPRPALQSGSARQKVPRADADEPVQHPPDQADAD